MFEKNTHTHAYNTFEYSGAGMVIPGWDQGIMQVCMCVCVCVCVCVYHAGHYNLKPAYTTTLRPQTLMV
jgi:hypothetical protein